MSNAPLPPPIGYSIVPPRHVANVATFLEMRAKPVLSPPVAASDLTLERWHDADLTTYRALFKAIGENWMWYSRLVMPDHELLRIFRDSKIEIYRLFDKDRTAGFLELDFSSRQECELSFLGLVPEAIGKGAGRFLMDAAIRLAWSKPITRFWVHTCTFDHPAALSFYQRSGFTPYQVALEIHPDPRLTGHMPREAAPHVPIIER
ncbi:MAG: GNAT family N-acetyltransferase [Parvibaculaceae bacterium]